MKKRSLTKQKENTGITLIALVITIIVLLILAGISIATLTGENGLLTKANTAKRNTEKASAEEQVRLAVFGSYDANGRLNIDKLKEELRKIQGTVTITDTNGGFSLTVTVDGYSFIIDENGKIEPTGTEPTVDQSSLKVTLKDGEEIPTDGAEEGTELKITFTASMEHGAISNVTPGTLQNGQISYISTGTEKEVTFKLTGKVGNDSYETTYKVALKEYYKKTKFEAGDIKNAPNTFYGAEVTGYTCSSDGVSKWRIFYSDGSNIYLIADDYIDSTKAPKGQGGSPIYASTAYKLAFTNVYKDYKGSEWILGTHTDTEGKVVENSLAKKWLNKYFNYTPDDGSTYPNRTSINDNIRAVAYMMDAKQWHIYAGEQAEYAIGGVPVEMYFESYKQTHLDSSRSYNVTGTKGYFITYGSELSSDCDEIYVKPNSRRAKGVWLASPSHYSTSSLVYVQYEGRLGGASYGGSDYGLRPLVCLKSEVQLKKTGDRVYAIQ